MKRVILKRVGKEMELVETEREFANEVVQDLLGNEIRTERVVAGKHFSMFVDSEGVFKNLPVNFSVYTNNDLLPMYHIQGDVVFIKYSDNYLYEEIWDYEVEDVSEEDIELVKYITEN